MSVSTGGFDAIQLGHLHVHEDEIEPGCGHRLNGLAPVTNNQHLMVEPSIPRAWQHGCPRVARWTGRGPPPPPWSLLWKVRRSSLLASEVRLP
jgi:hypothetical protein